MTEPFPSDQYIKLCTQPEVAEKLREEWEPRPGDWFLYPTGNGEYGVSVLGSYCMRDGWTQLPEHIPLFTLRQLIRMLEERGCTWNLGCSEYEKGYWLYVWDADDIEWEYHDCPDPETALLRAWLEVVNEQKKVS